MAEFKVDIDFLPLHKKLAAAQKNQFPFAISRSLNMTVSGARQSLQSDLPSIFTLRRDWIVKGIQYHNSTKHNLVARVGSVDPFLVVHTTGGIRTGRLASVPGAAVRPTFPTLVRRTKWPGALLRKGGRRKAFMIGTGSDRALVRRKRIGKSALETLWRFPGRVKYRKAFPFDEMMEKYFTQHWRKNMKKSLDLALATAK